LTNSIIYHNHPGVGYTSFAMNTTQTHVPQGTRPPKELLASPAHLLKRMGFVIKDRYMEAFESTGLGPAHYAVLALLEEEPAETQGMIADALGYDRSHLVGLLDELEELALIERRRDPEDRRRHLVSLTADGKKRLKELRAVVKRVDDEVFAPLDEKQRETLRGLLVELTSYHEPRYKT
jgi:DNA-binding MarR family transcriptional regulator